MFFIPVLALSLNSAFADECYRGQTITTVNSCESATDPLQKLDPASPDYRWMKDVQALSIIAAAMNARNCAKGGAVAKAQQECKCGILQNQVFDENSEREKSERNEYLSNGDRIVHVTVEATLTAKCLVEIACP